MRVPTLHTTRQAFQAFEARQADQVRLQGQLSSGLRVSSPGDDPLAAAQAEQARSRLARLAQDERSTQLAAAVLATADGALAEGAELLQTVRESLVAAGNGSYGDSDRQALAAKLRATRDSLLELANSRDGAGGYVFSGQGASARPLVGSVQPEFAAAAGIQRIGVDGRYAVTVDGVSTFMEIPQGNGVFVTASAAGNQGWIDAGEVVDPTQLTGHAYSISIGGAPGALTLTVRDETTGAVLQADQPWDGSSPILVAGQKVKVENGAPADSFSLQPAGRQSVFATLDQAIALLETTNMPHGVYAEQLQRVQSSVDRALDAVLMARTKVGAELNGVEQAVSAAEDQEVALARRRSDLEDMDLARGISELQHTQATMEAALRSYATLTKITLFDLIG